MKTKDQKQDEIREISGSLPGATITIFTTFARPGEPGLSVAQLQELKRSLRKQDGEYAVVKKTLADRALRDAHYDGIDVFGMDGSIGLVLGHGDVYAVAKTLHQFAKKNPALKLFAAWTDGHALNLEQLLEMAMLPSKEELLARLCGMLRYPISGLAVVLNQIVATKA